MNHYLLFLIGEPGAHDFVISAAYICYYYAILCYGQYRIQYEIGCNFTYYHCNSSTLLAASRVAETSRTGDTLSLFSGRTRLATRLAK